jgi:hypothetical protein
MAVMAEAPNFTLCDSFLTNPNPKGWLDESKVHEATGSPF